MTAGFIPEIIMDSGGTNQITIYTFDVKHNVTKTLTVVNPPQSSANWATGAKVSKIVDLLRVEDRYTINGKIDEPDIAKYNRLIKAGGVIIMVYDGSNLNVAIDKAEDVFTADDEAPFRPVTLSVVVGEDM